MAASVVALVGGCSGDDGRDDGTATVATTVTEGGTTTATTTEGGSGSDATTAGSGSGSESATEGTTAGTTDATTTATTTASSGETTGEPTTGGVCPEGCEDDGGVCVGDVCCEEDFVCGEVCCGGGEVCSFNTCVVPGDACIDASECAADEYCEYSLGEEVMGGEMCQGQQIKNGKCLPSPPECGPGEEPMEGEEVTCLTKCEYVPDGSFNPVVKYHWDQGTVMMAPIVIQLDDDNCDGIVDERDIPEIVFSKFINGKYNNNGTVHAISIVGGELVEKWSAHFVTEPIQPGREIAGGDIDGQPGNEIVVCTESGRVRALNAMGEELWISADAGSCVQPTIADLDQDGVAEILVEGRVLDGATGATKVLLPNSAYSTAADLDGDGQLDIVHARGAFNAAGGVLAQTGLDGTFPAVADLDLDGKPEIAVISNNGASLKHHLLIWRYNPDMPNNVEIVRGGIDINADLNPNLCPAGSAGNTRGGGPPTIADFNGDGTPDVAVAGGVGYAVFDGTKLMDPNVPNTGTPLWIKQTKDCSSAATGSSVFDFDGDGSAEVVYSDEHYLRIYKGATGDVLWQTCNTTGTLREFPLIADVDNDGHADIVAVSNNYSGITCEGGKQTGVRIFGDAGGQWVRTRRIWNQHAYHVTNVSEDGSIPAMEQPNWTVGGLNNFRQNVQPQGEFSAPDLIVRLRRQCDPEPYGLVGRVRNIGEASAPSGVPVYFYEGDPDQGGALLGMGATTKTLYPAEAEDVLLLLPDPPPGVEDGSSEVWVVVDDAEPAHEWHECKADNNRDVGNGKCPMPG
ncbi:MAG: VCBS repeat-containing protein [Nannocystaceae bacterium]